MSFLSFLFFFFGGLAMVVYREKVQRFTGDIAAAEKWFGAGGTFTLFLLIGLALMLGAIFYITGTLDYILQGTFGRVFLTSPK